MRLLGSLALCLVVAGCGAPPVTNTPIAPAPDSTGGNWISAMLATHNQVRATVGVPPLRWSSRVAAYAQEWAVELANQRGCQMIHRQEAGRNPAEYGENLYWGSPVTWSDGRSEVQNVSAAAVARDWASEVRDYNYHSNSCRAGEQCGHYTQMVWRSSQEVGCGKAVCPDGGQIWVCSYNPTGNWVGERPY